MNSKLRYRDVHTPNKYQIVDARFLRRDYSSKKKSALLGNCQQVIQQLKDQLQGALHRNQEQQQLINILTQQKKYYAQREDPLQAQYDKLKQQHSKLWNECLKIRDQVTKLDTLVNEVKKYNKQLNIDNQDLKNQLQRKTYEIKSNNQKIVLMHTQKKQLEQQWSRIVVTVRRKIRQVYQQKQNKPKNFYNVTTYQKNNKNNQLQQKIIQTLEDINQQLTQQHLQLIMRGASIKNCNITDDQTYSQDLQLQK